MRYRYIFGVGAFIALLFAMCMPAEGQVNVERLESIARHVAQAVLSEGDSLTVEQVAWVERMTAQLAEDVVFLDEQRQRLEEVRLRKRCVDSEYRKPGCQGDRSSDRVAGFVGDFPCDSKRSGCRAGR